MAELSKGDHVSWKAHGTTRSGTVQRPVTSETHAAGRHVVASEDEPQYLVRSDQTGKDAVLKPGALPKRS